jgi:hypothetical protein
MCIMKEESPSSAFERTQCVRTHLRSSPGVAFERMSTSAEALAFHVKGPRRTEHEASYAFDRICCDRAHCVRTHMLRSNALVMTCQHARKPNFFSINLFLLFVNPTLGGAVESKNTNFVVSKPLRTLFDCKFRFFMFSIDFDMSVVIMRG